MDYMDLGVRSRKTGLRVKDDIAKDEYNMENLEDFFKDEDTSLITMRRKGRKSSLLSDSNNLPVVNKPEINFSQLSSPHIFSPAISNTRRSSLLNDNTLSNSPHERNNQNNAVQVQNNHELNEQNHEDFPFLEAIHEEEEPADVRHISNLRKLPRESIRSLRKDESMQKYNTTYDLADTDRLEKTKRNDRESFNPYTESDLPDLVHDADDTIDNTSFNTSENAILEEEISEDVNSDYDEDYNSDMLSSSSEEYYDNNSIASENVDMTEDEDNVDYTEVDKTYIPSDGEQDNISETEGPQIADQSLSYEYGYVSSDNDDEYIPSQLRQLSPDAPNGIRKSSRIKIPPLEYWRNERVVFKRQNSKPFLNIDKIVTYEPNNDDDDSNKNNNNNLKRLKKNPSEEENRLNDNIPAQQQTLNTRLSSSNRNYKNINRDIISGKVKKSYSGPNSELLKKIDSGEVNTATWIKDGILRGTINSSVDKQSDEIIAYAPNIAQAERTRKTSKERYTLSVMFDKHKDMFASGMLKLPIAGKRDTTDSQNAFITFYVVQGVVEVTVSSNKFTTLAGCSFQIPSFNRYSFANIGKEEVKLFFVQVIVPETFDSKNYDRNVISEDSSEESSSDSESSMINLKNRHISDSETNIRPSSVHQKLFVNTSSSDITNLK